VLDAARELVDLVAAARAAGHDADTLDLSIRWIREQLPADVAMPASVVVGDHDKPGAMLSTMQREAFVPILRAHLTDFELLDDASDFAAVEARLGLPLFVKPATEGSSIGVTKVKHAGELKAAYEQACKYDKLVLAEQFIGGGEYTAAVLGERTLPFVKIEPATEFYDYQAKYFRDDTVYRCPSGLSAEREVEIGALVQKAFWGIGGSSWGRVDFLMDEAGKAYLLEVNTAPGMTSSSPLTGTATRRRR